MTDIHQALIMAAGEAKRMRPLTDALPKPLLNIGGKPLLTHIIDHLLAEDVTSIIINGYHAIDPLKDYVDDIRKIYPQCDFILSEETVLLETGGGAVQALQYLDKQSPFYMINGDAFWMNNPDERSLQSLHKAWDAIPDCQLMLLMEQAESMQLTGAVGDYDITNDGKAIRSKQQNGTHMFAGIRLCHPDILNGYKAEKFSFLTIMDAMEEKGQLYAHRHSGNWYHISTPADLDAVNDAVFGRSPA